MFASRIALAAALLLPALALADTVTVVTSFPKELTTAYKKAYEAKHPGDKLEILNKNTAAGIAYVREQPAGSRPEVFWASAPDAFEVLASGKLLQKVDGGNPAIPDKVGTYPINDPEGFYKGQALAGYGIMWNTRYLAANKLPAPKEWADLAKPVYFGHVADLQPVALRHHAPHGRDDPAGRRLEQGLGAAAGDLRQQRGDHRALLRRARRRVQRPVRHRPRDRLLRPRGEELRHAGGVRLSVGDGDRARQHRAGGRRQVARRPASASSSSRSPTKARCCCCRRRSAGCR